MPEVTLESIGPICALLGFFLALFGGMQAFLYSPGFDEEGSYPSLDPASQRIGCIGFLVGIVLIIIGVIIINFV